MSSCYPQIVSLDENAGLPSVITGMNPKTSFGNRFRSKLRGTIPLLIRDNSANKLLFASLLKFESHYPPLRGIVQLTNSDV